MLVCFGCAVLAYKRSHFFKLDHLRDCSSCGGINDPQPREREGRIHMKNVTQTESSREKIAQRSEQNSFFHVQFSP